MEKFYYQFYETIMFTSGNSRKLNQRAREVWLNAKHTKEDEIFALEKKKVGTK